MIQLSGQPSAINEEVTVMSTENLIEDLLMLGSIEDLKRYATEGHLLAQIMLGTRYHTGIGVPRNYEQAAHWFRKAAEQGSMHAQFVLGAMLL